MNVLRRGELVGELAFPVPPSSSYGLRLSPRVWRDLRLLTEATIVAMLQIAVHIYYYIYVLETEIRLDTYSIFAAMTAGFFFVFKRFVFQLEPRHLASFYEAYRRSAKALIGASLIFMAIVFLGKWQTEVSRGWLILWLIGAGIVTAAIDGITAWQLSRDTGARDLLLRRICVLGARPSVEQAAGLLKQLDPGGTRVVAQVELPEATARAARDQALADIGRLVSERRIDEVVLALPWTEQDEILRTVEQLAPLPVDISLCPDRLGLELAKLALHGGDAPPFLPLVRQSIGHWGAVLKRMLDIVVSATALVFAAPLFAVIAIAIRLDSPGRIFFRQPRHGLNHEVFYMWKFRSMREGVDRPDQAYRQATANDDRVTRVGRFLRRTSLDELPQLVNVLSGEMSLVGPRPHPLRLNERFAERLHLYPVRHRVRPGITGLAQINGFRGETDTDEKMAGRLRHDLEYIRQWSIWLDLKILIMTVVRGFVHPNAY